MPATPKGVLLYHLSSPAARAVRCWTLSRTAEKTAHPAGRVGCPAIQSVCTRPRWAKNELRNVVSGIGCLAAMHWRAYQTLSRDVNGSVPTLYAVKRRAQEKHGTSSSITLHVSACSGVPYHLCCLWPPLARYRRRTLGHVRTVRTKGMPSFMSSKQPRALWGHAIYSGSHD